MKSRKYPTFQESKADLESKGTLKYWGRIGDRYEICLYTYPFGFRSFATVQFGRSGVEIKIKGE